VVGPLITALKDQDRLVRQSAANALGLIGDVSAVEWLLAALDTDDWVMRGYVARALGGIGGARAVEALIDAVDDNHKFVRGEAVEALLHKLATPAVVDKLIMTLTMALLDADSLPEKREFSAEVLGKIGDARAVEALRAAAEDPQSPARRTAAEALARIRSRA
jgi:HEAT repeat protein